jgi:type VI secretion system protein ImpG
MRRTDLEELESYYESELAYLRQSGQEFARSFPKIAKRLELSGGESPDPQIERLLESFAFLAARIHARIDSLFPEVSQSLLGVLCPHLVQPVPSMAIARFEPNVGNIPPDGYEIVRGTSLIAASDDNRTQCRFRTGSPVVLWPIAVTDAAIIPHADFRGNLAFLKDLDVRGSIYDSGALHLELSAQKQRKLSALNFRKLRFYIKGSRIQVRRILDLLWMAGAVVIQAGNRKPVRRLIREDRTFPLSFGGFKPEDALLPTPNLSLSGFRLLQEYFAFPEKFFFFDLDLSGWKDIPGGPLADDAKIHIYFLIKGAAPAELEISPDNFQLNCTPIINLFEKTTEPVRINQTQTEYRLSPDLKRERTTEIYSIQRVVGTSDVEGKPAEYRPFFSFSHQAVQDPQDTDPVTVFWESPRKATLIANSSGTDVFLRFVDLGRADVVPPSSTVHAETLCTNRDFAHELSEDQPLNFEKPGAPVVSAVCLTRPSEQRTPPLGGEALWKLVSSLALNHLSLADQEDNDDNAQTAKEALREILRIFSPGDPYSERHILGLKSVVARPAFRRAGKGNRQGFIRGTEITITLHPEFLDTGEAVILVSALSHFFALYASVNSFTQVILAWDGGGRENSTWPLMTGQRPLL